MYRSKARTSPTTTATKRHAKPDPKARSCSGLFLWDYHGVGAPGARLRSESVYSLLRAAATPPSYVTHVRSTGSLVRYSEEMTDPVRILHVTDPHLHAHPDAMMRGLNTWETFKAIIDRVGEGHRKPDAVIATGDLVQDETRQGYERFRAAIGELGVPVHCVPGNHDSPRIMAEMLGKPPFHFCGTRTYGDWRLILLDSAVRWDDGGRLETNQLRILETTLEANRDQHTLIALHHHPLPTGSQWLDGLSLRNSDEFFAIIDRFEQVRIVAWGHVHQASERMHNNIVMLSTPSTGSQFLPNSDVFMMDSRPPGYRWIELFPDGSVETEVVWLS